MLQAEGAKKGIHILKIRLPVNSLWWLRVKKEKQLLFMNVTLTTTVHLRSYIHTLTQVAHFYEPSLIPSPLGVLKGGLGTRLVWTVLFCATAHQMQQNTNVWFPPETAIDTQKHKQTHKNTNKHTKTQTKTQTNTRTCMHKPQEPSKHCTQMSPGWMDWAGSWLASSTQRHRAG